MTYGIINGVKFDTGSTETKKDLSTSAQLCVSLYLEKHSVADIARRVGVTRSTVYANLKAGGVDIRQASKKLVQETGLSSHELAEKYSMSVTTVNRKLRAAGKGKRYRCEQARSKAIELYTGTSMSLGQVAAQLDVSEATVSRYLREMGIPLRTRLTIATINKLLSEGKTLQDIANETGKTEQTVKKFILSRGRYFLINSSAYIEKICALVRNKIDSLGSIKFDAVEVQNRALLTTGQAMHAMQNVLGFQFTILRSGGDIIVCKPVHMRLEDACGTSVKEV